MIYGYGLEYAQMYLDNNRKLSSKAQDEVKELLLKELVEDVCKKFLDSKLSHNKIECKRQSERMNKLKKFKMFRRIRYCYKFEFILEVQFYKYDIRLEEEE